MIPRFRVPRPKGIQWIVVLNGLVWAVIFSLIAIIWIAKGG